MPARLETISTLIAATLGALSFAGAAALIAKRRRPRRPGQARHPRRSIWETTDDDRIVVSDHPYSGNQDYQPRFARGARGVAPSARNVIASKDRAKEAMPRRARPAPR
jgi:hypothetical protein